jgi:hypothetical protein
MHAKARALLAVAAARAQALFLFLKAAEFGALSAPAPRPLQFPRRCRPAEEDEAGGRSAWHDEMAIIVRGLSCSDACLRYGNNLL